MNAINGYEFLSLDGDATIEDIQLSFAYLYRMIDLIYPLNEDGETGKKRSIELKKLETAYLSALNKLRKEIIINSKYQENTILELDKIEESLYEKKKSSIQPLWKDNCDGDHKFKGKKNHYIKDWQKKTKKFPYFYMDKLQYSILKLTELEICVSPLTSHSYGDTIKGELHMPDIPPLIIIGKIIKKEQNKATAKLVTRVANKWIKEFKKKKESDVKIY